MQPKVPFIAEYALDHVSERKSGIVAPIRWPVFAHRGRLDELQHRFAVLGRLHRETYDFSRTSKTLAAYKLYLWLASALGFQFRRVKTVEQDMHLVQFK